MKRPDPRVLRAEKLLTEALRLIAEVKAGVPPPRRRRKPQRRYRLPAILQALQEGASLDGPKGVRDPRLPSRTALAKYRKANPAFDREARQLLKERSRQASRQSHSGPTPGATVLAKRLPGQGIDWVAVLAKIEGGATIGPGSPNRQGLPSHTLIMARRKADPVFGARVAAILASRFGRGRRKPFDREAVLELVRRGAVIKAHPPEVGMPMKYVLDRERREDLTFNVAMLGAIEEARRRKVNRTALAKRDKNAAWRAADGAVPRSVEVDLRMDIVAELSLRLVSGEVSVTGDLQAAWKACRRQLTQHRWKERSLDAPISGTDGLTPVDLLAEDAERF